MKESGSGDCGSALVPSRGRLGDSSTRLEMDTNLHPAIAGCLKSAYGSVTKKQQHHRAIPRRSNRQEQEIAVSDQGSDRTLQRK
mgnify:FL=1